ncbi:MAG: efflux RND transporter periplasmic adaptor subunit [Lachnospiraceae bacterium]|nr:efflux RND transporter periplasmic adaptor subunit [Lachnospiraceae bacterium]
MADANDDVDEYKKKKKKAKNNGDEESYQKYKELLNAAEKTRDNAEQSLQDMEHSYYTTIQNYQTATGVRAKTNEEIYKGQQLDVMNSITVAQKNVESAAVNVGSAAIGVESAKNRVDAAEYQLSLYDIKAPIEGVVEEVNLENNNFYNAGKVGFVIANPDSKRAVFYVTDPVAAELRVGQEVSATVNSRVYKGTISEIAVATDETTGLFEIKAFIDGASDIVAGVGVKVRTIIHKSDNMVIVPTDSIYFTDNEPYVYLDENGTAVRKPVTLDIYGEKESAIADGIKEGEYLITSWSGMLHDGAKVLEENNAKDVSATSKASGEENEPLEASSTGR